MTTQEVANQLVALCRAGRNLEAVEMLLSHDVVSVEATGDETMPAVMNGRDAVRGKNEWWVNNHKVHAARVKGPYPNGDRFDVPACPAECHELVRYFLCGHVSP